MGRMMACAGLISALLVLAPSPLRAEVISFELHSKEPYGTFGGVHYVRIGGRVTGSLETSEPIPGLQKADRDGDGRVEYATDLVLIVPADPDRGNGTLLIDLSNRGRPVALTLYNSPRAEPLAPGSVEPGNGFLQERGFLMAIPAWELGHGIDLPSFTDEDGETRHVEGVGFAAVRDIAAWLKGIAGAAPDPLGGAVERALAVGWSQTARFLKSFLLHGFNAVGQERVFDGMHLQGAHAGLLPLLDGGIGPESAASVVPTFARPDLRGVHEPPFTYGEILAEAGRHGPEAPRLIVTNMANDYHTFRASLARTGPDGVADAQLPEQVRVYDVAGGAHVRLPGMPGCDLPRGTLDWHPVMRAVLVHLDRWTRDGTTPPESRLMPLMPADGPAVLGAPPSAPKALIQVPAVDQDGNDLGGVRLPGLAVPLGTYHGQNRPLDDFLCTISGGFVPFAATRAERERADPRLSLEERYGSREAYAEQVAQAAERLVEDGFMLRQDAEEVIAATARINLLH